MNTFAFVLFAALAAANAGVIGIPSARIIQGPSSRTTVVGPDGSSISAVAPGGQIILDETPGLVAPATPVVVATQAVAVPAPVAVASPTVVVAPTPVGDSAVETLVAGPSGTIITGKSLSAPANVVAIQQQDILPQSVSSIAIIALEGLEGQYVEDNLEKLYDDGSYKPQLI